MERARVEKVLERLVRLKEMSNGEQSEVALEKHIMELGVLLIHLEDADEEDRV
jgi:hypothetical protein